MLTAEDRLAIIELVQQADSAASRRDYDAYAKLYAEDGTMGGIQGDYVGRDAIRNAVKDVWAREPADSLHLTNNIAISEHDGVVEAHSLMVIIAPEASRQIIAVAAITQRVKRTTDGWVVTRRHIAKA